MVESNSKIKEVTPLVSICCITYNHAPFIRKCLDGFLMQKVDFPIEILIHDDCSTDGTTEIIKEYAAEYPDLIFPLYETINQYSQGKANVIDFYNYKRAKGKYIAYCEGDDYWTDQLKLQKQIDFMELNQDYSVCFHKTKTVFYDNLGVVVKIIEPKVIQLDSDIDISSTKFINGNGGGQPLSMVFRKDCYDYSWQKQYDNYCDTMEIYHLLRVGKGRILNFCGGQYNIFNGVSATMNEVKRFKLTLKAYEQMYMYTKDIELLSLIENTALWGFEVCKKYDLQCETMKFIGSIIRTNLFLGFKVLVIYIKRYVKTIV